MLKKINGRGILRIFLVIALSALLSVAMDFYKETYINWAQYEEYYPLMSAICIAIFAGITFTAFFQTGAKGARLVLPVLATVALFTAVMLGIHGISYRLNAGNLFGARLAIATSYAIAWVMVVGMLSKVFFPSWKATWYVATYITVATLILVTAGVVQFCFSHGYIVV